MANRCRKHSPLLEIVLRALLHPSIDPRLWPGRPRYEICLVQCRHHQRHRRHSLSKAQGSNIAVEFECTNTI